jgi:hypothetical protein
LNFRFLGGQESSVGLETAKFLMQKAFFDREGLPGGFEVESEVRPVQ